MLVLRGGRPREVDVTRLGDVVELRLGDAVPADLRRASLPLVLTTLAVVVVGALMPITPLAPTLGFQRLPLGYSAALAGMVLCCLALVEVGKRLLYRTRPGEAGPRAEVGHRHPRRRAARFSTSGRPAHWGRPCRQGACRQRLLSPVVRCAPYRQVEEAFPCLVTRRPS
ncbi:hypothetical protein BJ996_000482 [Streptomyces phaeogriseichromatogenes]|nr:hypothetical protein [Streptomyces murinus]